MKVLMLFSFLLFLSFNLAAQNFSSQDPEYIKNAKAGERCLLTEKYDSCNLYFKKAFEITQTSYLSTLRAACCAFSSNDIKLYEDQMTKAMEINWDGVKNLFFNNPEFSYLHHSTFEDILLQLWEQNAKASGIHLELMMELEAIAISDQKERGQMRDISSQYGWESEQMDSLWKIQLASDKRNLYRIEEIIETHGYPGKSLVGTAQSGTAFLVIQHAELDVQEKYLTLITEAADKDEVSWRSVALLVDRVNMRNGLPQIYGSQIGMDQETGEHYFAEIENPEKIDSIRATVGLGPIQAYANNWNLIWDPVDHRKKVQHRKEQNK